MTNKYNWSAAGYNVGSADNIPGKMTEWSRGTVADGKWLNRVTIQPFSGRDEYLLESINDLDDKKQPNLSGTNGGYGITITGSAENVNIYVDTQATECIYPVTGSDNDKLKFKLSADITANSITATTGVFDTCEVNDLKVINLTVDNLSAYNTSAVNISAVSAIKASTDSNVKAKIIGFDTIESTKISATNISGATLHTTVDNVIKTYNTVTSHSANWGNISALIYYDNNALTAAYNPNNGVVTLSSNNIIFNNNNDKLNLRCNLISGQEYEHAASTTGYLDKFAIYGPVNAPQEGASIRIDPNDVNNIAGYLVPSYANGNIITSASDDDFKDKYLALYNNQWVTLDDLSLSGASYYGMAQNKNNLSMSNPATSGAFHNTKYGTVILGSVSIPQNVEGIASPMTGCFAWGTYDASAVAENHSISFKGSARDFSIVMGAFRNVSAHSIGLKGDATDYSCSLLYSTAADRSFGTNCSSAYAHSFGALSSTCNNNSVAMLYSSAGNGSIAINHGNASFSSIGIFDSYANQGGIAINNASAIRDSLAINYSIAKDNSVALGAYCDSDASACAVGCYNEIMPAYTNTTASECFVVGNGTTTNARSNAFVVFKDGTISANKITTTEAIVSTNTKTVAGIVSAPGNNNNNKVWRTDDNGNPGWGDGLSTSKVAWSSGSDASYRPIPFANAGNKTSYDAGADFDGDMVYDSNTQYGIRYSPTKHQLTLSSVSAKDVIINGYKFIVSNELPGNPGSNEIYII